LISLRALARAAAAATRKHAARTATNSSHDDRHEPAAEAAEVDDAHVSRYLARFTLAPSRPRINSADLAVEGGGPAK
jgi:hypothetical protein